MRVSCTCDQSSFRHFSLCGFKWKDPFYTVISMATIDFKKSKACFMTCILPIIVICVISLKYQEHLVYLAILSAKTRGLVTNYVLTLLYPKYDWFPIE